MDGRFGRTAFSGVVKVCTGALADVRRRGPVLFGLATLLLTQQVFAQAIIIDQARAKEIARQNGWLIREESPTGVIELHTIVNGVPKYYTTHNADAADTISTDECLPGGSSGLGLTGAGVTFGVWDADGVSVSASSYACSCRAARFGGALYSIPASRTLTAGARHSRRE